MRPERRIVLSAVAAGAIVAAAVARASAQSSAASSGQPAGSIRGVVYDEDFQVPLPRATVTITETGQRVLADEQGNYVFPEVPPGTYTLSFSKDGYGRQFRMDVQVASGGLTDVSASLVGEVVEMEEFISQDVSLAPGSEAALLRLRFESPALLDSVGRELISRAGASDAAAALRLVPGASTQDGRFPVVRGLPDRYVSSQLNFVRLPTADADKRAVPLDLFPATVIESIQVSKTFTPDQQGDASGGAVNLILKGIPDSTFIRASAQYTYNTQVGNRDDFLTYQGGGIPNYLGKGSGGRDIQYDRIGENWAGAAGVSEGNAPTQYKWNVEAGARADDDDQFRVGGYQNFFWEQDAEYFDNGKDRQYWVTNPGQGLVPLTKQGIPDPPQPGQPTSGDFKTALYDVTQGSELVRWGWLGTAGVEFLDSQKLGVTYLYTRLSEDTATLAQDTSGKEYFYPGYDPNDLDDPGNAPVNRFAAPYLRAETLEYSEQTTSTLIFNGHHELPVDGFGLDGLLEFDNPEIDWTIASSAATADEPDKRQFGSLYVPNSLNPGAPPFLPPFEQPQEQLPYKPDANFLLGNFQRTFQSVEEDSTQFLGSFKLPFQQWTDTPGFIKLGLFDDTLNRTFNQDTFSNLNDNAASFPGSYDELWSAVFPDENHPISDGPPFVDVDYRGKQDISAFYAMADLPLIEELSIIGGARVQDTSIGIRNIPEVDATWFPPGSLTQVKLNPGDADVSIDEQDTLPSVGIEVRPLDWMTWRMVYAETIALPIFKELTPIQQQEFLGGDVFIGNPNLRISDVENFDIRVDLTPLEGGLISASYFYKDILNPIEYVQKVATFTYTTPENFPKGTINGVELEARQQLGTFWEPLTGLTVGANATFIDSEVDLPPSEIAAFAAPNIQVPITSRDMTGAPEYIWNLFVTLDVPDTGTQFGCFYTVRGDTLVAGAGVANGNFIPDVYADEFGTLNLTLSQKLGDHFKIFFQAKNLTDPEITEVYRSSAIGGDVLKSSYTLGVDLVVGLSAEFTF